jgi:hypothetical protein
MPRKKHLGELLSQRVHRSRSELYRWLYTHHAELVGPLSVPRPPWKRLAELAAEQGVKSRRPGSAPTQGTVRAAWARVQEDMRREGTGATKPRPRAESPALSAALAEPLTPEPEYVPGPRRPLKTATPRKFIPTDEDTGL